MNTLMLVRAGKRKPNPNESWLPNAGRLSKFDFEVIDLYKGKQTFDELWSKHGLAHRHLIAGRLYLVSPTFDGQISICSARSVGEDADQHPWVRMLRAKANHRIAKLSNPWVFKDNAQACYLQHRLDTGDARLTIRYRYAKEPDNETNAEDLQEDFLALGFERCSASQTPDDLETRVYVRGSNLHHDFRIEAGGDSLRARADLVKRRPTEHAEVVDANGTKRLLRALRYGDGSGLRVTWKQTKRLTQAGGTDQTTDKEAITEAPFFDQALAKFRRCLRTNSGRQATH